MSHMVPAVCYECGCEMVPKPPHDEAGHCFWECPNCGLDTEKDFDDAVQRAIGLGVDIIGIMREEDEDEEEED